MHRINDERGAGHRQRICMLVLFFNDYLLRAIAPPIGGHDEAAVKSFVADVN